MTAWSPEAGSETVGRAVRGPGIAGWLGAIVERLTLPQTLLLAAALRLAIMPIATPVHPDEVFTYLEMPHRLLFRQGVLSICVRRGLRGWLTPLLVAGPMAAGATIAPGTGLYIALPNLVMAGLSLTTVVFAWKLGERLSRPHAQVAAMVAAVWCEFVYFAPHVMTETLSIAAILPAALILTDADRLDNRRIALAGALLSLAATIRFEHAPAIAVLAIFSLRRRLGRAWGPFLIGCLVGLLPSMAADVAMGDLPFSWVMRNYQFNIAEGHAAAASASGPLGYLEEAWPRLTLWIVPLVGLATIGARRFPALAASALANLLALSAIAHKEYRYLLFSLVIAVVLAAVGTVDLGLRLAQGDGRELRRRLGLMCLIWLVASVNCAFGGYRTQWMKYRPGFVLEASLRHDAALCGLALYRYDFPITGGYTYLHRAAPMFYFIDLDTGRPKADLTASQAGFNTVLARASVAGELPNEFSELACDGSGSGRLCLYRRPGPCAPVGRAFLIDNVLKRLDQ